MGRWSLAVIALALSGCMAEGGVEDPPSTRDAIGLPEDFVDEDTGFTEEEDTGPIDEDGAVVEEDTATPDDDTGGSCKPVCPSCGNPDGCGGTCMTGACTTGTCVSGKCVQPTRSYLSPGDYAFGSAWARGITWTIASEGASTIRYTLDGSTPGPTSPSKPSPAELFIASSGTVIKWYSDNGAKEGTQSFTATIDTSAQSSYGFVVEKTNLGGKGPTIVVSPGATVTGNANYQAWNSSGCPMCRYQLVYGIETTSAGCLYDYSPSVWPGVSGSGALSVKAPTVPGVYPLNVTYTLQTGCANGMATNPLGSRPTARIATIVVR